MTLFLWAGCLLTVLLDSGVVERPRLIVLTDVSSLHAGEAEPDDGQSLIRLMLYANDFDIEGLIATSNLGHGQRSRADLIHQVVDAYARDRLSLLRHDARYPDAEQLRAVIRSGMPTAGPKIAVERCIGPNRDTEASRHLIARIDHPDPRPLNVIVWGGPADLAQALWRLRHDRGAAGADRAIAPLRVHMIGDQDSTAPWIRAQFPRLHIISQERAYRGMYRGGDTALVNSNWVKTHIHGHGALGDLYPDYSGGDPFGRTLGGVRGIKEGDTPSFLSLIPNGLTDPGHPGWGSWGGRFAGEGSQLRDVADHDLVGPTDPDPRMSSVYRWRPAFQNDFQARLDWCVRPFGEANHAPVARIRGEAMRALRGSGSLALDARDSTDPDGDPLDFRWTLYPHDPQIQQHIRIDHAGASLVQITVEPGLPEGLTIPVLLTVTDRGTPPLSRYARAVIVLEAAE
jgi:hypothetical protein